MELFLCWMIIGMFVVVYLEVTEVVLWSDYPHAAPFECATPWWFNIIMVPFTALIWPFVILMACVRVIL